MSTQTVRAKAPDPQDLLPVPRSHEEARRYYNRVSRIYDLVAEKSERWARLRGLERFGARSGEKSLEIGFGTGHSLVALARAVGPQGKVFGVDISEGMTEIATARLNREGLSERVDLLSRDAIPLPYPSAPSHFR